MADLPPQDIPGSTTQGYLQRVWKDCLLTQGERNTIALFKERYRSEVIREQRVALVKSEIMTAYFNYLHQEGQAPKTDKELKMKTKVNVFMYVYSFTSI